MFNPKDIIEALAGNVRKTRSPFGTPRFMVNGWWKKMSLTPRRRCLALHGPDVSVCALY